MIKRILGVDPGTTITGYAVIEKNSNGELVLISLGYIELSKLNSHYDKLKQIHERVTSIITSFSPDELAIEAPFYGENVQSMLKLGRAQGAAIVAAMLKGLPVYEYSPRKIKLSITGNGNASKEQIAAVLKKLFKIENLPSKLDATDGLAVAFCHYFSKNSIMLDKGNTLNSWKEFVKKNGNRIIE